MKVAFLTNLTAQDSLPILRRLGELAEQTLDHVYFYDTLAEAKKSPLKILREFGLRRVVGKLWSSLGSRIRLWMLKSPLRRFVQPQSALEWAIAQGMSYSVVNDLNGPKQLQELADRNLDLLLVCVCKNILRTQTIETPKFGTLNIHPSLLPKYRGPMPVFWTLYYGEKTAGVSFQKMIAKIDAGPVLVQYEIPIAGHPTEAELSRQLFQLAAEHLGEVLQQIADGNTPNPIRDDSPPGSYYSFPSAQQQAELRARQKNVQ